MFGFEGLKEVYIEKVERDKVGLDLVELCFRVSHLKITIVCSIHLPALRR